jgi:WXG100 family type VII secretion target
MKMEMKLTRPELDNVINRTQTSASNLHSLISKMDSIMDQLAIHWRGSAQMAYQAAYEQIRVRSLMPTKQLLDSYPVTLRQASTDITYRDDAEAQSIRTQFGGLVQ